MSLAYPCIDKITWHNRYMTAHPPRIILASQSPRRKELLTQMGAPFTVIPSKFEENLDSTRPVEEVAIELALGKARTIAAQYPQNIVIGADTIVLIDGIQLGKPADKEDARRTLQQLAGRMNMVATGLAVLHQGTEHTMVSITKVFFKPADHAALEQYLATGDWHDKAGAYGIQSGAAPLIDHIEGEYDAVLGLPTRKLATILHSYGIACSPAELHAPIPVISV